MTLIGNRPEWVLTMLACFRIGAVVLPCTEQLRAKDIALRIALAEPDLIVADERNRASVRASPCRSWRSPITASTATIGRRRPRLGEDDPCLITFTSGTSGEPSGVVHAQRYLNGQRLQAEHWLDPREGELVWCTASSGWSSRPATSSSRHGCAVRPPFCTTLALTLPSGSS